MSIFDHYRQRYEEAKDEELSLQEFLDLCREDRSVYANAAERLYGKYPDRNDLFWVK
ncbi:hypothetical protein [Enterovibrio baiacu]|uniref:hypothetical protein n=1 Tax=Enterovibrio baiacu TaxID=2491023 RepID=UPI00196A7CBE|nr:hypothetical protein [Enterovibrio baiacu]